MTIDLHNLTVGYERHPAVHHVSGAFTTGAMTAIIGPNGGGKSTLLKALIGFLKPLSGHISYNGIAPRQIAYMPQRSEVDRSFPLSVEDVAALGHWPRIGAFRGINREQKAAVTKALAEVGMSSFAERPIEALSSGQWQRVLFARLIVQDAPIILLDEPFSAIDSRSAHDLVHVLQSWHKQGRTVIAVMHDLPTVRDHFPKSLLLARELVAWGPTADVLTDSNLARAAKLAADWVEDADTCERHDDERPTA
jgi:zinc/manganese transport system ATP-binding protein